jgi:phosphoglycolate phosphatase
MKEPMTYKAVLFDLDGTLLDTIGDLTDAMNEAMGEMGLPGHDVAACKYYVGDGLRNYALRALPEGRRDEATLARCCELFRAAYARCWHVKTRPYEGIPELLDALAQRKLALCVLSNKPDDFTKLTVRELLAQWRFAAVRGVGADGVTKPDPAGALAIAAQLGLAPADFFYVGDTGTDMATAAASGMYGVGATWGYRPAGELIAGGAKVLIDGPTDLLELL